jgi:hypothetical protein
MPGRILCYVMIIQWVVVQKSKQTTIVVNSAHVRFTSVMPILLFFCVFACYGPSAFYLTVAEQNSDSRRRLTVQPFRVKLLGGRWINIP